MMPLPTGTGGGIGFLHIHEKITKCPNFTLCLLNPALLQRAKRFGLSAVKLFSKNSNLYEHDTSTSQADRRAHGQTTCLGNTTLRVASCGKNKN